MNFGFDAKALISGDIALPGAGTKSDPFELRAGPFFGGELRVLSISGRERVNDVYTYEVTFATAVQPELLPAALFGEPAHLTIKAPGHEPRVVEGIAASLQALGAVPGEQGGKRRRYRLEIVPRLWLLKHRRQNRIFQNKNVLEIVQTLLDAVDILPSQVRWRVRDEDYPKLPFVYQRDESDYDFFRRVLADAGIFFYFEHANGLLDSLLPGAGAVAGVVGEAAGMLGGAVGGAVAGVEAATGMVAVLNFGGEPGHTPAVTAGAVAGAIGGALTAGLNGLAGAVGASAVTGTIEDPSDTLPFDDGIAADAGVDRVYEFAMRKELRPKELRFLDRDVEIPASWVGVAGVPPAGLDVSANVSANLSASLSGGLSLGAGGLSGGLTGALTGAVHAGVSFDVDAPNIRPSELREEYYQVDPSVRQDAGTAADKRMLMELERVREKYVEAVGRSDCRRLGAAYRFTLAGHPIKMLNGEYTVTSLDVEGVHPDFASDKEPVYRNRFRCIPSKVAPRPKRRRRRRKLGMEVATVVGYVGGESMPGLHASAAGYVKIRFRWDIVDDAGTPRGALELGPDDADAIWVPIVQPWAGAGYGAQFIPRDGMEVLVGFLESQGERPIILGCLHSEASPPPWPGEIENQKVGIRSQTRPVDGGYSEISIDDRQDDELVKLRAQRDMFTEVVVDARTTVGNDRSVTVGRDTTLTVGANATTHIGQNRSVTVTGDSSFQVSGDSTFRVAGSASSTVEGDADETVVGDYSWTVCGRVDATTEGEQLETYEDNYTERHLGHRTVIVGTGEAHRSVALHVEGAGRAYASKTFEVVSLEGFQLTCGKSRIFVTPEAITISTPKLVFVSKEIDHTAETYAIAAKDKVAFSGQTVSATSSGASLSLDGNASIQASKIQLKGGSGATSQDDQKKKVTKIKVSDPDGNPLPDQRVLLRFGGDGGEERMVVLDENGEFEIESDDPFDVFLPDLPDAQQS